MALVPIISQTWDTTSVFTPTRMNNIEQNLAIVSKATGVEYSNGVSVKDKIDDMDTTKTGNLIQGSQYSTYVNTLYTSTARERAGIVSIRVAFSMKGVTGTSGYKEIFKLPSNITKPSENTSQTLMTQMKNWQELRVDTNGNVFLNGGETTVNNDLFSGILTYIT